ncbi:MAG TPA: class I SAM-dependent methyltransferase [Mycobacteriales bacterium]|nr:class I SAM-dependent methyltransferase [Mycobacteriales bacterium]
MTAAPLTLTGERTLPGIERENYWFRRHEAAYLAVAPFCRGALVLDAGCGEGYGAALLRRSGAARTVAVDLTADVVAHVAARYPALDVVRADLHRLPLRDGAVEVVVTSQTVEHLQDQAAFVAECARVLRPSGTLVVTTPNRLTFSPGLVSPVNPFHTRELSPDELVDLLSPHFAVVRLLGVSTGRRLRRWERRHGSLVSAQLAAEPSEWPDALRRVVRSVTAADFAIGPGGVDSSLDLVAVAVRRTARTAAP